MPWFAIRTVYHFGVKADGTNVFEERVVSFEAASSAEAHHKADVESEAYAKENDFIAHSEQSGYKQDGAALIDGYEIWSELFESRESLEQFYASRYSRYLYMPEPPPEA
jgi:hypothetical protein